jgi:hypothetical protein
MSKVDTLQEVVSSAILRRAADISHLLNELGIPHVLVGGLAVGSTATFAHACLNDNELSRGVVSPAN